MVHLRLEAGAARWPSDVKGWPLGPDRGGFAAEGPSE
ncbi:hypothetical protein SGRA_p0011 (plasmid) [Saprospira grandis str. Lewin]|uniref:Uncharacterized protein n=1 Tax=Saprospira grandis (strain Lewin) TaxID=984262 RepID=H6LAY6_SAPGL|nr:hypothetical protein SGRA_p0011 [Saprospira grandis str. Lewin]